MMTNCIIHLYYSITITIVSIAVSPQELQSLSGKLGNYIFLKCILCKNPIFEIRECSPNPKTYILSILSILLFSYQDLEV